VATAADLFVLARNRGAAYLAAGQLEAARASFEEAIRLRPDFADGYRSLGIVLVRLGHAKDGVACLQESLRIQPDFAPAHNSLGIALQSMGRFEEATRCFQNALRYNPAFAEAHSNLGNVWEQQNKLDEAISCYKEALRLRPDFADAHSNLGCIYLRQGRLELALASFRDALRLKPDLATAQSNLLACSNYDPDADPDGVFAEHCRWGKEQLSVVSRQLPENVKPASANLQRPLRVGYVSPNLCFHPVMRYLEPVLVNHDPAQVEVFCYAEIQRPDALTARLQRSARGWCWTSGMSDADLAQRIRNDRIDILVDLAGHTARSRLAVFAYKPAPIQVTWLGYMNTTGLTTIDYRLTDSILDPPGQPVRDTEELLRLPEGMCCFAPPADAPGVAPLPALQRGHLTFGSLNGLLKLNYRVFDLWSYVLKAVPGSRLLMFHHMLAAPAREHIQQQFGDRGIAPERLDLRHGAAASGYLRVYGEIDVSLDTFPCTGGVTTCESLWMGVPVLSMCGVRPAARNTAALLARVGLGDWAVGSKKEYVAFAARVAEDLGRLALLRAELRERMVRSVCDGARFTRGLEEAYRGIWKRRCGRDKE